jgi:hypothetical protein
MIDRDALTHGANAAWKPDFERAAPIRRAHLPAPEPMPDDDDEDETRRPGSGGGNIDPEDDEGWSDEDDEDDETQLGRSSPAKGAFGGRGKLW